MTGVQILAALAAFFVVLCVGAVIAWNAASPYVAQTIIVGPADYTPSQLAPSVVARLGLATDAEFRRSGDTSDAAAIARVVARTSIVRRAQIITLQFASRDGAKAAKVANALTEDYLSRAEETRYQRIKVLEDMREPLTALFLDMTAKQNAVDRERERLLTLGQNGLPLVTLRKLERDADEARAAYDALLLRANALPAPDEQTLRWTMAAIPYRPNNPVTLWIGGAAVLAALASAACAAVLTRPPQAPST